METMTVKEYMNATAAAEFCKKLGHKTSASAIRAARLAGNLEAACVIRDANGQPVGFGFDSEGVKEWLKNRRLGRPPKIG
jgi:hypothetical protein